jgi:hypothetical protein
LLLVLLSAAALSGGLLTQSCHGNDECPSGEHLCGIEGCSVKGVCPAAPTGTAPGSPDAATD